jgi:hypothetical protein
LKRKQKLTDAELESFGFTAVEIERLKEIKKTPRESTYKCGVHPDAEYWHPNRAKDLRRIEECRW